MRLRREGHTSLTRKTSTIWSETLVLPSPMLNFWHPGSSSGTCWMKAYTDQRKRHQTFSNFFSRQDGLCFCNNVAGLFEAIGITCNPSEWRLFIDSSSRSLKAVLLHNGNNYPSLSMAHSVHLKEDYTVSKCCWVSWSMTTMDGRSPETSKWCHSWWAFKAVSRNFLVSFASGTAVTLRRTITERTGHNVPSSLWGKATSSGSRW